MIVDIEKGGEAGTVTLDEKSMTFVVDFPDKRTRGQIERYLVRPRKFRIPESQEIDDFRIDEVKPTESPMYFDLALCTLWANTGVLVSWRKA